MFSHYTASYKYVYSTKNTMEFLFLPCHTRDNWLGFHRLVLYWQCTSILVVWRQGKGIRAGGRVLRHVNRYTHRERKAGHLQRIRTFPIPSPPGCWRTPPAQMLLHAKALLYPANTYNWIRWNIQQPLTLLSFYHWDNTSKPFIKRQLYIQKKEHVGKTLCKTTPELSLNGDAPALQLNMMLWSEHVRLVWPSHQSSCLLLLQLSHLPAWVPFQDKAETGNQSPSFLVSSKWKRKKIGGATHCGGMPISTSKQNSF